MKKTIIIVNTIFITFFIFLIYTLIEFGYEEGISIYYQSITAFLSLFVIPFFPGIFRFFCKISKKLHFTIIAI